MAFTPAEESRLRVLLGNDSALNTLAQNEPAIIQELGAQDITIDELQSASSLLQTDKLLGRFGGEDKAVALSVIRAFVNNGMAALSDLALLLPKRNFALSDSIRIPDAPGGLIIQWGSFSITSVAAGVLATSTVTLGTANPSALLKVMLTPNNSDGVAVSYSVNASKPNPNQFVGQMIIQATGVRTLEYVALGY